jgi:hypothetical protein
MKKASKPVRSRKPVPAKKPTAKLATKSPKPQGSAALAETVAQLSRTTDKLARAADKLAEAAMKLAAAAEAQRQSAEAPQRSGLDAIPERQSEASDPAAPLEQGQTHEGDVDGENPALQLLQSSLWLGLYADHCQTAQAVSRGAHPASGSAWLARSPARLTPAKHRQVVRRSRYSAERVGWSCAG